MIDAHPALKAASPQAPDRPTGSSATTGTTTARFFLPHAFNFLASFGQPRPEPTKKSDHDRSTTARPTATSSSSTSARSPNADAKYFKDDVAVLERGDEARHLRRLLEGPQPAAAPEEHQAGGDDRRRLVRRREPVRRAGDLQARRGEQPRRRPTSWSWARGSTAAGAAATATSLGDVPFNAKTAEFYREQIEFPFFEYHLKGKGDAKLPEAWVFETGTNQWRKHDAWPPQGGRSRGRSTSTPAAGSRSTPAGGEPDATASTSTSATRPSRCRIIDKIAIGMTGEYMIDDQRFAARRPDVLVYQTDALDDDLTIAGPIQVELHVSTTGTDSDWVVKLIDVYPDDYPDPNPNPTGVQHGRLPAAGARRRDARQVPQQLREARAVRARQADAGASSRCRTSTTPSAPATGSWCRCRAPGSRWSTATRRRSSTSTHAKESDFQKATQRVFSRGRNLPNRHSIPS